MRQLGTAIALSAALLTGGCLAARQERAPRTSDSATSDLRQAAPASPLPDGAPRAESAELPGEPEWMLWLDEVGFDPLMTQPSEERISVVTGRMAGVTMAPNPMIRRSIRRQGGRLRACYERRLQGNPALAGRVTARFVISPEGAVLSAAIASSTLGDAEVEACVVQVLSTIRFAPTDGTVVVTYPLLFQRRSRRRGGAPPREQAFEGASIRPSPMPFDAWNPHEAYWPNHPPDDR